LIWWAIISWLIEWAGTNITRLFLARIIEWAGTNITRLFLARIIEWAGIISTYLFSFWLRERWLCLCHWLTKTWFQLRLRKRCLSLNRLLLKALKTILITFIIQMITILTYPLVSHIHIDRWSRLNLLLV
jgi:hypothetical protein